MVDKSDYQTMPGIVIANCVPVVRTPSFPWLSVIEYLFKIHREAPMCRVLVFPPSQRLVIRHATIRNVALDYLVYTTIRSKRRAQKSPVLRIASIPIVTPASNNFFVIYVLLVEVSVCLIGTVF